MIVHLLERSGFNQKSKYDLVLDDPNAYVCGNLDLFVKPVEWLWQKSEDPQIFDLQQILDSAIEFELIDRIVSL